MANICPECGGYAEGFDRCRQCMRRQATPPDQPETPWWVAKNEPTVEEILRSTGTALTHRSRPRRKHSGRSDT